MFFKILRSNICCRVGIWYLNASKYQLCMNLTSLRWKYQVFDIFHRDSLETFGNYLVRTSWYVRILSTTFHYVAYIWNAHCTAFHYSVRKNKILLKKTSYPIAGLLTRVIILQSKVISFSIQIQSKFKFYWHR